MSKKSLGLFDEQFKLERISKLGDPLEKLNATIDWELFRYTAGETFGKRIKRPRGPPTF